MPITADQFRALPRDVATTPRDGDVYCNRWWATTPEGLLFYQGRGMRGWAPQCNHNRAVVDRLARNKDDPLFPDLTVEFFPVVYLGPWNADWGHNPFHGAVAALEARNDG